MDVVIEEQVKKFTNIQYYFCLKVYILDFYKVYIENYYCNVAGRVMA